VTADGEGILLDDVPIVRYSALVPPRQLSDRKLLDAASGLFRQRGFEGVSIADLSQATGLQKSSLYHRCPGGKDEIALQVIRALGEHFGAHVLAPLAEDGALDDRLGRVAANLTTFYADGRMSCLLETLSLGATGETREALRACLSARTEAFASAAREAGCPPAEAGRRSRQAVARIQGALVISRITGDEAEFRESIADLPRTLGLR
jgi:AcrR family transcriptional regulator